MMNPSPTEIVELFVFAEVTLIQYATVAGHFPGVNASSVKPKLKKANQDTFEAFGSKQEVELHVSATVKHYTHDESKCDRDCGTLRVC